MRLGEIMFLTIGDICTGFKESDEQKEIANYKFEKFIRKLFQEYHIQWNKLCEHIGPEVNIPKLTKDIEIDDIDECLTEMDRAEKVFHELIKETNEQIKYKLLFEEYDYEHMKLKPNNILEIIGYIACGIMVCESVVLSILAYGQLKKELSDIACMYNFMQEEMQENFLASKSGCYSNDYDELENNAKQYKERQMIICDKYIKEIDDEIKQIPKGKKEIITILEGEKNNIAKAVELKCKEFSEYSIEKNNLMIQELKNKNQHYGMCSVYNKQIGKVKKRLALMKDELKNGELIKIRKDCEEADIGKINIKKEVKGKESFFVCTGERGPEGVEELSLIDCKYFPECDVILIVDDMKKLEENTMRINKLNKFMRETQNDINTGILEEINKIKIKYSRQAELGIKEGDINNISEGYKIYKKETYKFNRSYKSEIMEKIEKVQRKKIMKCFSDTATTCIYTVIFVAVVDMMIVFFEALRDYYKVNEKKKQMEEFKSILGATMEKSICELAKLNQNLSDGIIQIDKEHLLILQGNQEVPVVVKIEDCV
ncbi:MAG: hypothetical protein ACRCSG_02360 [Cellulosilyticaceae bacterium]